MELALSNRPDKALGTARWKKLRLTVLMRDAYQCGYCGADGATTVDHRISRARGGSMWDTENLIACCKRCNSKKNDKSEALFLAQRSTPPVFLKPSLPETIRTVPDSPFNKPDTLDFDAK
jgi:5-methylcytosine-specific restriction endonuclease McrA